jgi:hypothetical protein
MVDGLNDNVDIFKMKDFTLIGTLNTNSKNMIAAIVAEGKIFIAT